MTISQIITAYSGTVPAKSELDPTQFDLAAEAFVKWWVANAPEINTLTEQINAESATVNSDATDAEAAKEVAQAAANFAGEWSTLTGALTVPSSVAHEGVYWMLLTGIADVTASEPSITNTDWLPLQTLGISSEDKAAAYTITFAEAVSGNRVFNNTLSAGEIKFDLPPRTGDFKMGFLVTAGHYLKVSAPLGE